MVRQQATSADETVSYEVHRPAHIRGRRLGQRLALEQTDPFALAPPYDQASFAVEAIDALAIDLPAVSTQTQIHAPVAIAALDRSNLLDART